jgi:AraC-like DNA-binding protein/mannose-6-phosphate isomerase-like protein (cupin superfamily)
MEPAGVKTLETPGPPGRLDPDHAARPLFVLAEQHEAGPGAAHAHKLHQLIYAVEGVLTIVSADGRWVVPPQRGVWVPAGTVHRVAARSAYSLCSLYVSAHLRRALPTRSCVVEVTPLLREALRTAAPSADAYALRGPVHRLLEVAVDQIAGLPVVPLFLPALADPRAAKVAAALTADPSDRRTLAQWGYSFGASARLLERAFKRDTHLTFSQWRTQLRLMSALELLADGQPVTQVALAVGYEDPSSFIAVFRSMLAVTPARYFGKSA